LRDNNIGFFRYALCCAQQHKEYFSSLAPLGEARSDMFESEVKASISRQAEIEASDEISFEEYLAAYFKA